VGAGGGVSGSGSEVVRIVGVKGVACDELKARGLKGPGLRQKNALRECGKDRGGVVVESGVETTGVMTSESWALRGPFGKDAVFRGEGQSPGESEVGRLLVEGAKPVRLVRPCPSLGEVLPCNEDVSGTENVRKSVEKRVRKGEVTKGTLVCATRKECETRRKKKDR